MKDKKPTKKKRAKKYEKPLKIYGSFDNAMKSLVSEPPSPPIPKGIKAESKEDVEALTSTLETFQSNISSKRQREAYKAWGKDPAKAREQFPDIGSLFEYFDKLRSEGEI